MQVQKLEVSLDSKLDELVVKEKELSDLKAEIQELRNNVEGFMVELEKTEHKHTNFSLHFRTNSESHRMNWKRFQKEFAAIYKQLKKKTIITLSKPKKAQSLVFKKVKAIAEEKEYQEEEAK